MNNIVSWEYYNSHFPKLSQEEYNRRIYRTTILVTNQLSKNIEELSGEELIRVMDCICAVLNNDIDNSYLSSVSNDGYSESYNTNIREVQKQNNKIMDDFLGYLRKKYACF